MRRRQAKTARDAGMKRVTLRIPEQHAREIEWSVTHGPKGITAAAWIRAAIRQHESRRDGLRKERAPTPPPDRNEARVTVRISAQDERRIRRRYMQARRDPHGMDPRRDPGARGGTPQRPPPRGTENRRCLPRLPPPSRPAGAPGTARSSRTRGAASASLDGATALVIREHAVSAPRRPLKRERFLVPTRLPPPRHHLAHRESPPTVCARSSWQSL